MTTDHFLIELEDGGFSVSLFGEKRQLKHAF